MDHTCIRRSGAPAHLLLDAPIEPFVPDQAELAGRGLSWSSSLSGR